MTRSKAPRKRLGRIFLLHLACAVILPLSAFAEEAKKPAPLLPVAVVPYDPDKPISEQDPTRYYVDYATFETMWNQVKENRFSQNAENATVKNAPQDHTLSAALYRIRSSSELLTVTGQIALTTRGKAWQKVPLPFSGVNLSRITLDGEPASYRDGAVLIEEIGSHLLEVEFQIPLDAKTETATWKIPPAAGTMLRIEMDSDVAEPVLQKNWPLAKSRDSEGGITYTAAIGQETSIEFRRRLKTSGRGMTSPNLAVIDARLYIAEGLERLEANYRLDFQGQEENRFTISFDASLTPVQFEIPNLSSWEMEESADDLRSLTFTLSQPVQDRLVAKMIAERIVENPDTGTRSFPALGADAMRIEQQRSILRVSDLSVKTLPGTRHRQIPFPGDHDGNFGFEPASTFSLMGKEEALRYEISAEESERSANVAYVYQVGSGKLETIAKFRVRSPKTPLLSNSFSIPTDAKIQLVSGNRIRDWWRTGDELFVRYSGGTPETTELIVYITQQVPDDDSGDLTIAPIAIDAISEDKVKGTGLIVGHVTREVSMSFDQNRQTVREVGADEVLQDSEILPPLERKRGFRFEKSTFSGSIALSGIAPKFNALWVMLAEIHESWTRMSIHTDIEVTQSGLDRVEFETPEAMPQLRVLSDDVRELRHELADGVRKYEIVFQKFVTGSISFTLETEIPHGGDASLPDLSIPEASRQERYVIVENHSDARITSKESGLDKTIPSLLPFKPQSLNTAQLYRATPGWSMTATLEKLETSAGNAAVILYAELTSSFRANGEEWLKAVYHIQNRSLQFLPVQLQEDAELVSVVVDGVEVRADRGETDGGSTILVPLIQTKPGQLAYDVELVLRSRERVVAGGKLQNEIVRTLNDPDVLGTTVEKTMWNVYLPAEHVLEEVEGNMDQVAAEENLYRKLQSDLQELKYINSVGGDFDNGAATREFSVLNGEVLVDRIEDRMKKLMDSRSRTRWNSSQAIDRPILPSLNDVSQELEQQKVVITENRVNLPIIKGPQEEGKKTVDRSGGVQWDSNSIEIKNRGAQERKQSTAQIGRVQSQMRFNDNISIANGVAPEPSAAPAKESSDYSSLQKLAENPGSGEVDSKLSALNFSQIGHANNIQQAQTEPRSKMARQPAEKKKAKKESSAGQPFGDYGNARAVVVGKKTQAPEPAAPKPATATADPFGGMQPNLQSADINVRSDASLLVQKDVMRAEGRRSVRVEFPTEGQAYYFQKLKDHAELKIESEVPGESERGKWLLLLLASIGALFGAKVLTGRLGW